MMQFLLHPDVFTDFPNNETTKTFTDNRHVSQNLSTSSCDSVRWTCSSGMTAILGVHCAPAESWLWQKASTHHMTIRYINPLSPVLQTTPTVPSTMTTYHLYFDPGAIFQACWHVRSQCYETLTVVIRHMLCVVLQGKALTALIWNMVCKLHAAQTVTLNTFCKFYSSVASPIHSIHT